MVSTQDMKHTAVEGLLLSLGPALTSVGASRWSGGQLSSARAGTRFQLEQEETLDRRVEEPVRRNLRATGTPDRPTWMDSSRREANPP